MVGLVQIGLRKQLSYFRSMPLLISEECEQKRFDCWRNQRKFLFEQGRFVEMVLEVILVWILNAEEYSELTQNDAHL